MKGVIVTLSFLFVFSFASAQIEDGKFGLAKIQPQLDFTFGNTNEIDFLLGANAKNLYWGFGLYFTSIGVGKVASVGKSGVDFSSISNGVILEENIFPESTDTYATTYGVQVNVNQLLGLKYNVLLRNLYIVLGTGYLKTYYYQTDRRTYVFNYSSNEHSYFTYESKIEKKSLYEVGLSMNLVNMEDMPFTIGLETTYISSLGMSYRGVIGCRIPY